MATKAGTLAKAATKETPVKVTPKPIKFIPADGVRAIFTTKGGEELIGTIENGVVYRNIVRGGCQVEDALYEGVDEFDIRPATNEDVRHLKVIQP